jgi:hypothetical protein
MPVEIDYASGCGLRSNESDERDCGLLLHLWPEKAEENHEG